MSTTTTERSAAASTSSLASSVKFRNFAIVFAVAFPILYVICDIWNLPLFTFHPSDNHIDLFWAPGRSGMGPAMYWYGWTATCLVVGTILGVIGSILPDNVVKAIPKFLIWALYIVAVPLLVWSLMPFWTK